MNTVLYRSRVWRSFHWLPTLALPLIVILFSLAESISYLLVTSFTYIPRLYPAQGAFFLPLLVGMGSIGRDSSTGLLPVLLTRPLRRSTYVLSHWAALGSVASLWALLHLVAQVGLILAATGGVMDAPFRAVLGVTWMDVLFNGLGRLSLCFGLAAVLVTFSARLPAFGNAVLWLALYYLVEMVLPGFGKDDPLELVSTVRQFLAQLLMPMLDFRRALDSTPISWARIFTYLSNVSLWLLLAVHIFNSREVSYASR